MKVAMIKQVLDVFGPWLSVRWQDKNPERLFDIWPGKAILWEMTCLLEADWYIIPQRLETDYIRDAVLKHSGRTEMVTKYTTNVVAPTDISFEEYDVVITFDPILDIPDHPRTIFAYYMQEHWDPLYSQSLQRPIDNYDLFLAHMMDSEQELTSLPQAISFPYLRAPDVVRSTFQANKEEAVWVDWRTLTTLGMTELWNEAAEAAAKRLEETIGLSVRYRGYVSKEIPYGISDPPLWGDAAHYLEALGHCKYYIAVGRSSGAGQGLCDAASLGCICIGEQNKAYHRLVCHPACLCADMGEMPGKLRRIISSPNLQEEVICWQDEAIRRHFVEGPLSILEKALWMKRKEGRFCMSADAVTEHLRRFLRKPWREKIKTILYLIEQGWSKSRSKFLGWIPIPIRLAYGCWCLAWPDVMGQNIRSGDFEENERYFVERFLKPGVVFFDVGAHIGFYTLLAACEVGDTGLVVAFEPSRRERRRLRWNLALNRCHNVQVEPLALGDYNGQTDFFIVLGKETGCNSMRPPAVDDRVSRVTVPVTTLDNYLSQSQISSVDFIKLDVEGAELPVLKGASGLLTTQPRPVLICELIDMRTAPWNYRAQEIYQFLAQLGYTWFSVAQGGYLCPASRKDHYHENLVAVPEEGMSEVESCIKRE